MPVVDIVFPAHGNLVPSDHGYMLFSALNGKVPVLHDNPAISVHPLCGQLARNRFLRLTQESVLTIRCSHEYYGRFLELAGQELMVGPSPMFLGVPRVLPLRPRADLYSRLVVIKPHMESTSFLAAARRQLMALGINAQPSLIPLPRGKRSFEGRRGSRSPYVRRTVAIRGRVIVGFALEVNGLSPEDSILLQSQGLGGRHRMGCGVFVPITRREQP